MKNFPFSIFQFPLNFHFPIFRLRNKWQMADDRWQMQSGQSMFELVVAIAISAIIIVAIVSLVNNSLRNATFSKNNALAGAEADNAIEWLRAQRDTDINSFMLKVTSPNWCFTDLSWSLQRSCIPGDEIPATPFLREGHFTTDVISGKTVITADITVSWTDAQGIHQVESSTSFTDWRQR